MTGDFSRQILLAANGQRGLEMNEELGTSFVALSRQPEPVKTAMIERLCKGLNQLASPSGAGFVAIWLGIEVENGADPGRSVEAVLQCFFRWSQRVGTTAGDGTADAEIVAGLRLLGQSLISHISRMPDLRSQLAGSPEILTELGRIEHHSSGAAWFLRLLSQRSGKLLLINVLGRYGFHIRYQNLANCFHLFTLLQGELAKILHGTPPARPLVIIPKNHWVENWTSPAFYERGERHEEIEIYGRADSGDPQAGRRRRADC